MRKSFAISVCLLILLAFSTITLSKIALWPLSEMVEKAETIAVGSVVQVEKTDEQYEAHSFYKATISIERILKGDRVTQNINIYFLPDREDEARYSLHDKSIFFIMKYRGKNRLVQGIAGKVDIKDNQAVQIYMLNEKGKQRAADFIKTIESAVNR